MMREPIPRWRRQIEEILREKFQGDVLRERLKETSELEACLRIIPLLSPEHQHILKVLAIELAKLEGIEVPNSESEG